MIKKYVVLPVVVLLMALFFSGCMSVNHVPEANRITVFVSNETDEVIEDVFIRWGSKYYWGEHLRYFEKIQPGEKVKFTISTDIEYEDRSVSTSLDMSYSWQGTRLDYWNFVWQINQKENATWDFRLQGLTAVTPVINPRVAPWPKPGEKWEPTNIQRGMGRWRGWTGEMTKNELSKNVLSKEEILYKAITEFDKQWDGKGAHEQYEISIIEDDKEWRVWFGLGCGTTRVQWRYGRGIGIGDHAVVSVSKPDGKTVEFTAGK